MKEGEHVWDITGKARHTAVIISLRDDEENHRQLAIVRWTTGGAKGEVDVTQLRPMFEDGNVGSAPSPFSRRQRKPTDRFAPPPPPSKKVRVGLTATGDRAKELDSDYVRKNLGSFPQVPSGIPPGPGWTSRLESAGRHNRTLWMTPRERITFRVPRQAFEFEGFRRQCNGDERKALGFYKKLSEAAVKKHCVRSHGRFGLIKKKPPLPLADIEEGDELSRNVQTEPTNKISPTSSASEFEKDAAMGKNNESDQTEKMDLAKEQEYNKLWDYYLKPPTRENEEMPSGMILRVRKKPCNLLRSKNSVFRHKLHAKIMCLYRQGKRAEIFCLLKSLNEHDETGALSGGGDGPRELLEKILGRQASHEGVEVLDSLAVSALQDCAGKGVKVVHVEDLVESNASAVNVISSPGGNGSESSDNFATSHSENGASFFLVPKPLPKSRENSQSEHQEIIDLVEDAVGDEVSVPALSKHGSCPGRQQRVLAGLQSCTNLERRCDKTAIGSSNAVAESSKAAPNRLRATGDFREANVEQEIVDLCNDEDDKQTDGGCVDEVTMDANNCQLNGFQEIERRRKFASRLSRKLMYQQLAARNIRHEWMNEETTVESSIASSSTISNSYEKQISQEKKSSNKTSSESSTKKSNLEYIDLDQESMGIEVNQLDVIDLT